MAQEDCVTHRKCCIRLHLELFSLSPREKKPCKSGQLSGPISLFLFPELPGLPAADSAPLGFLLLVGFHPSSLRSRCIAVTAGNVLTISPGRSEVTVPSWHIRLLPCLFTVRLLSCGKPESKVSWCVVCSFLPIQAVSNSQFRKDFFLPCLLFIRMRRGRSYRKILKAFCTMEELNARSDLL